MEIWILPGSECIGANVVGEERNEPNHSPILPTPEEGRDWMGEMLNAALDGVG
jgi:hypothetical protein